MSRTTFPSILFGVLLALATASPVGAQGELESSWMASRAELERRVTLLDALTASSAYSTRARERAATESALIRRRLSEGDFRIGDRIYVQVEGSVPVAIPGAPMTDNDVRDTVTVLDGQRINVRTIGEISLAGVLRSELQGRVSSAVSEVVLNARSLSRPLVRLAVFGSVARPGFYIVPMETRLDALVMLAGGPNVDAATNRMRFVRGDTVILAPNEIQNVIAAGSVIGAIGLQEGDQLYVERGTQRLDRAQTMQFAFLLISPILSALIFQVLR